jgi:RNA polymerase-binding transcription factor DksA
MPWFEHCGGRVWAGYHRVLGAVVFDPANQQEVPSDRVRLFVVYDLSITLLHKETAHECINATDNETELRKAVAAYFLQRTSSQGGSQHWGSRRAIPPPAVTKTRVRRRRSKTSEREPITEVQAPVPGICVRCRNVIPAERLVAAPGAIRCVRCQAQWEQESGGPPLAVQDLGEVWFPRSEHWRSRYRRR